MIKELNIKGAQLTCSYEEELRAGTAAIEWLNEQDIPKGAKVVIATDNQSLCKALSGNGTEISELIKMMSQSQYRIVWQWIPGHSDIEGNEIADRIAKEATRLAGPSQLVSLNAISAEVKNIVPDKPPTHERTIAI